VEQDSPGTRIGQETYTCVPAEAFIRPLRDHIIVEPLEWRPSKTIEVVYHGKPLRGRVRAVGPGRYPLKYNGPKGKRTKSWDSKTFVPTEVKVGDTVELGGLELRGYLHQTIRWGNKEVIMCREADVAIVYD
jgi:co-chaperonin GroES (HSP10)